ncbi:uroporphyrinogen decarboxylase [Candidatus Pelagibacter sp.]|uniref:uroporphyrinogen decarboxylase n=1 Tax=Candidatus Pelagibacter sp. TaxID=2024849 RepID=UPI003F86020D
MSNIKKVIKDKKTNLNPVWIMRQAGRYLPEFREIRKKNTDFIKLCLNSSLSAEITLQPLKRFDLDAAIIFSDILILPYGLKQKVEFKKNVGPILGDLNLDQAFEVTENDFIERVDPVYKTINLVRNNNLTKNKSTIGFVGAPWTLLVYILNKQSPKIKLKENFFKDFSTIEKTLKIIDKFLKVHIKNQIDSGAEIIQIFDSWAGLLEDKDYDFYIFNPTCSLVEFTKSLNVPVICFPRGIKDYKKYCEIVKPDAICIDYEVDPIKIEKEIKIPVQGGMDPKVLLTDKENLKREAIKYLDIFKDHPYIFNLGHGILPETDPSMMDYLVKTIKDY